MTSLFTAFILGYCSFFLLRIVIGGKLDNRWIKWAAFFVTVVVVLVVKLVYANAVTMVMASIGMQLAAVWLPLKTNLPKVNVNYIFIGTLLVMDLFLGIPVFAVFIFKKKLGKHYFGVFTVIIISAVIAIYYWQKADIITIYLLGFTAANVIGERVHRMNINTFKKTAYLLIPILLFLVLFLNRYVYHGFGIQPDIFRHGSQVLPIVALTFDDGPDPLFTSEVLDILQEKEVPGTFFMVGKHVKAYPEIAKRVVREGHEIGNHTYSHANLLGAAGQKVVKEITEGQRIIEEVTGERPIYFRPPRGLYSQTVLETIKDEGLTMVLWSISSQDWVGVSSKDIVSNIIGKITPGSIMLFHDSGDFITAQGGNRTNTVRALPIIIDALKNEGYNFVSITDMRIFTGLIGDEETLYIPEENLHE